ncbi:hypothetical protein CRG98_040649, partial [Punica granatum]
VHQPSIRKNSLNPDRGHGSRRGGCSRPCGGDAVMIGWQNIIASDDVINVSSNFTVVNITATRGCGGQGVTTTDSHTQTMQMCQFGEAIGAHGLEAVSSGNGLDGGGLTCDLLTGARASGFLKAPQLENLLVESLEVAELSEREIQHVGAVE